MRNNICLLMILFSTASILSGCARSSLARRNALLLQNQMGIYQTEVDAKTASQEAFYKAQSDLIDSAKQNSFTTDLDAARRSRAGVFADTLSEDPDANARMSILAEYLVSTDENEYAYYQELRSARRQAAADLSASIAEIELKSKAVAQVKESLGQLSSSSKNRGTQVVDSAKALLSVIPVK